MGKIVNISNLKKGDCGIYKDQKFLVTERYAEDRASGSTVIVYENGTFQTFVWEWTDPQVLYTGRGGILIQVDAACDIEADPEGKEKTGRFDDL